MIQKRFLVRAGARTTAGGTVRASSDWYKLNGVPLALEGDPVDCPACNTTGVIRCVAPRLTERFNGKQYALHDDLCICQCSPPPKLIAEQTAKCQIIVVADELSENTDSSQSSTPMAADGEPVGRDGSFDEMFVLKDEEGVPVTRQRYKITAPDGRVHEGVTNDAGETARIYTLTPQRLILELV